jgi:hypothetical protein
VARVQPGEVLQEAWQLYKTHWRHLLPIALVVYLALSLIALALTAALGWVGAIAGAFVSLAGIFWLQGALVEAVADVRDGRADLSIGDTLRRIQPRVWAIAGAGILAALGILVGLVLLIVPGLILLTWWSLILPVIVLERAAVMESFGRSRDLVRGNGWNVFGLIVLTVLILIAVSIVVAIAFLWLPDEIQTYVTDVIGNTLTAPFIALAWTLMYYRLRERRPATEPPPADVA